MEFKLARSNKGDGMDKVKKTTIQPLNEFLKALVSVELEFRKTRLKLFGKKPLWQRYSEGERIKIPRIK